MSSTGYEQHITRYVGDFEPTSITASETFNWFPVRKGDIIVGAKMMKLVLAADSDTTFGIGDSSDLGRFVAATDMSAGTVLDVVTGVVAAFPYVYLVDDTVDVRYVEVSADETLTAKVRVWVYVIHEEQSL